MFRPIHVFRQEFVPPWYNDFDIILDPNSRVSQPHTTRYAPCNMLYFVPVLIGC